MRYEKVASALSVDAAKVDRLCCAPPYVTLLVRKLPVSPFARRAEPSLVMTLMTPIVAFGPNAAEAGP